MGLTDIPQATGALQLITHIENLAATALAWLELRTWIPTNLPDPPSAPPLEDDERFTGGKGDPPRRDLTVMPITDEWEDGPDPARIRGAGKRVFPVVQQPDQPIYPIIVYRRAPSGVIDLADASDVSDTYIIFDSRTKADMPDDESPVPEEPPEGFYKWEVALDAILGHLIAVDPTFSSVFSTIGTPEDDFDIDLDFCRAVRVVKWSGEFILAESLVDPPAPVLTHILVTGAMLVLIYNEVLDLNSTPQMDAYTVTVAGATVTVSDVTVRARTVGLSLLTPVTADQPVTLTYMIPPTDPIQDLTGDPAAALNNRPVTNITPSP